MEDIKRLKGARDLALLNHQSLQTEESEAILDAAEAAYQAALNPDQAPAKPAPAKPAPTKPGRSAQQTKPAGTAVPKNFTPPAAPAPQATSTPAGGSESLKTEPETSADDETVSKTGDDETKSEENVSKTSENESSQETQSTQEATAEKKSE